MRKQVLYTALAAALAAGLVLPAAGAEPEIGDVVGHTYYTDITAQINGRSLRSYNIGGETAVVAEDLREYGFSVVWDGERRTLAVERDLEGAVTGDCQPQEAGQAVGEVSGDIYYTDIRTYVQGELVESFALNGETAIRFSELERAGALAWEEVSPFSAEGCRRGISCLSGTVCASGAAFRRSFTGSPSFRQNIGHHYTNSSRNCTETDRKLCENSRVLPRFSRQARCPNGSRLHSSCSRKALSF